MLFAVRGNDPFEMHFTYPIDDIDRERENHWKKQQVKENAKGKSVREDWSAEEHSLTAFFANHKDFAKKASIVDEEKSHVIDLFERIIF